MNRKQQLIDQVNSLLSSDQPHMLRVFISGAPDLKWILTSTLTPKEINERIRAETKPDRLYKEVPVMSEDLTVIAASEQCAETLIKIFATPWTANSN